MIISYIICKDKDEAKRISKVLINKKLAACCNIIQTESLYHWKNKLVEDTEVILLAKTLDKNFPEIKKEVLKIHSYKIPCILKINVKDINASYLNWLKSRVK